MSDFDNTLKKFKIKDTKRAIYQIRNTYPDDDLIKSYKDFLYIRDYLHYYQFNPTVFHNLVELTNNIWDTTKRISRLSLVNTLKRYVKQSESRSFEPKTTQLLFQLFQHTICQTERISKKQLPEIQRIANYLLKDQVLNEQATQWLCDHVSSSPHVINRMLRYPSESKNITRWVGENCDNDNWRNRRAELIGWVLNENPSYIVADKVLIADFECMNRHDKKVLKEYLEFQKFNDQIDHEFQHLLEGGDDLPDITPNLNFSKRFYDVPLDLKFSRMMLSVPDFNSLEDDFFIGLNNIKSVTMQWGAYYSKLPLDKKVEIIKRFYNIETYWTTLKLGKKLGSLPLLEWLLRKLQNVN